MKMGQPVEHRQSADFEDVPRPVVGVGNDYPASFELAEHTHRRGQFLYAASGVVAVSTPEGLGRAARACGLDSGRNAAFGANGRRGADAQCAD